MPLKTCPFFFLFALALVGCAATERAKHPAAAERELEYIVPVIRIMDEDDEQRRADDECAQKKLEAGVVLPKQEITFIEVINCIREATGTKITVNWPAIKLVGVEPDTPLLLGISHLSGNYLLRLATQYVSADAFDDDKMSFTFDHGLVKVSTIRDLKSETHTAVYDVSWYILPNSPIKKCLYRNDPRAKQFAEFIFEREEALSLKQAPAFDLNDVLFGTNSDGPSRNSEDLFGTKKITLFSGPVEEQMNLRVDELLQSISTTVGDPDEWLDEESTISVIKDKLVIKTTRENQLEIEALLTALNKAQALVFHNQARQIEVFLLLDEAEAYRLNQHYGKALTKIAEALRVDPGSAEAWALHKLVTETISRDP